MLGFEEGWDERGRALGKETSRARIQRDYWPETLKSNETWTQKSGEKVVKLTGRNENIVEMIKLSNLCLGATMRQELMTRCSFVR